MGPLSEWTALPRLDSCGGWVTQFFFFPVSLTVCNNWTLLKIKKFILKRPFYASRWEKEKNNGQDDGTQEEEEEEGLKMLEKKVGNSTRVTFRFPKDLFSSSSSSCSRGQRRFFVIRSCEKRKETKRRRTQPGERKQKRWASPAQQ